MIGIFDSGVGGLTVLRDIHAQLPDYSTLYLGDNANAPYGARTHDEITDLAWRGVEWLFGQGCELVVLACNSASAQALRTIQQTKLGAYPGKRVLGVIRPTVEHLAEAGYRHVLVLGTPATVASQSYVKEFAHLDASIRVSQYACPRWVPLIEAGNVSSAEARTVVAQDVGAAFKRAPDADAVLLACTHYPVVAEYVREAVLAGASVFEQGPMVAGKLADYLVRHPEMEAKLVKTGERRFVTTGDVKRVEKAAAVILEDDLLDRIASQREGKGGTFVLHDDAWV